jgi:hypothetical protein
VHVVEVCSKWKVPSETVYTIFNNKCKLIFWIKKNKRQMKKAKSYRHALHACQRAVPQEVRISELFGDPLAALNKEPWSQSLCIRQYSQTTAILFKKYFSRTKTLFRVANITSFLLSRVQSRDAW